MAENDPPRYPFDITEYLPRQRAQEVMEEEDRRFMSFIDAAVERYERAPEEATQLARDSLVYGMALVDQFGRRVDPTTAVVQTRQPNTSAWRRTPPARIRGLAHDAIFIDDVMGFSEGVGRELPMGHPIVDPSLDPQTPAPIACGRRVLP